MGEGGRRIKGSRTASAHRMFEVRLIGRSTISETTIPTSSNKTKSTENQLIIDIGNRKRKTEYIVFEIKAQ